MKDFKLYSVAISLVILFSPVIVVGIVFYILREYFYSGLGIGEELFEALNKWVNK